MKRAGALLLMSAVICAFSHAGSVRGKVTILHASKNEKGNAEVVVWLTALQPPAETAPPGNKVRLAQKNKRFVPHLAVVTVGTPIDFPNQDPFFHNVFSIYRGKPFDLGLYESGSSRTIRFTQAGVSYIFCNIHPEMSAVVIALKTRYFAVSDEKGDLQIANVPPGKYRMEVWYERAPESELSGLSREVTVGSGDAELPQVTLHSSDVEKGHLNKYGEPYDKNKPEKY